MRSTREVFLRGIMEAPCTDANRPKPSINVAQYERDQAGALYAVDFDTVRGRHAAEKDRRLAENDP